MDPTTDNNNDSYNDNSSNTRENNGNGNGNGNGNRSVTRNSRKKKKKKKYESHSHSHSPHHHPPPPLLMSTTVTCSSSASAVVYRECLKNHAASIGGQALDGCGEFMASPSSNPSDPSSLTCAACSCHRNFHRRLPTISFRPQQEFEIEEDDEGDIMSMCSDHGAHSTSPPPQLATHMLLALSTGYPRATAEQQQQKKRFRSKFSQEQKEKMHELSERLGWRLQRRDDAIVEAACREIGITRGVFKVWMHNNKHIIFTTNNKSISSSISSIPPQPQPDAAAAANIANGHGIQNLGMRFNASASSS